MSWKRWSIKEWNDALVDAVFLAQGRAETTISRIDASGRFLMKCTKEEGSKPEEALELFINAFGHTASSVRAKFRASSQAEPEGTPKCFAALYLTLLAASADNETAGVGDFRERFSKIVKATTGQSIDFSNLPRMWSDVRNWSAARAQLLGDCALLALPDPKNERLIGYSKRIAFPAYKDEIFLRKTLQKYKLLETFSFVDVARAVSREIGRANTAQNFLEEFREFQRLVVRSENKEAYESPFWGAVRDICLEDAQVLAIKRGIACLEIDIAEPTDPQLYLYMDDVANDQFKIPSKELYFARRDSCKSIAFAEGKYPSAKDFQVLATKSKNFNDSKIGKGLSAGWFIFLPNYMGALTSDGSFYDGGPVCFIAKNSELSSLIALNDHSGPKAIKLGTRDVLDGWLGLYIPSVREQYLALLLTCVPASIQLMLRTNWAPPRPRLSGGAWYGQMLLLNPASNPIVRMSGAIKGVYRFLGGNSEEIQRGDLTENDGAFQIPVQSLIEIDPKVRACEFMLSLADKKTASTKILLTVEQPEGAPAKLRDRSQWLVDGPGGMLCRLDAAQVVDQKAPSPVNYLLPKGQFPSALKFDPKSLGCVCIKNDTNDLVPALNWLADALILRFERRSSLTFDLLNEHVVGAAFAAGYKPRALRLLLFYGQWLVSQIQRNAPYSSISRSGIEMAVTYRDGQVIARIVGMFSRQSASRLVKLLLPGEAFWRIEAKNTLAIGCFEIKILSELRAVQLAQEIGAQLVQPYPSPLPLAALSPLTSEMQVTGSPTSSNQAERWDWGWSLVGDTQVTWPVGELRRTINGPRAWYCVKLTDDMFVKTDSAPWAWMASSVARGEDLGRQTAEGCIIWSKNLVELPASLTRWWMLFGGGCIAMTADGQTIFTGYECSKAIQAMGWRSEDIRNIRSSVALTRRRLAMRLKNPRLTLNRNL